MTTITITKNDGSTETAEPIKQWCVPGTFHDLKQRKYHTLTFITEEE